MSRVSKEALEKLSEFINSLPDEARSKCALCNETLTHIVKQAEAQTGAGTATVARELANRINENAAPGDRVSDQQLRCRVQRQEGLSARNEQIKPEPDEYPFQESDAWPRCKQCGEEKVSGQWKKRRLKGSAWIPKEDSLCRECRNQNFEAKRAEFEARPVDPKSE